MTCICQTCRGQKKGGWCSAVQYQGEAEDFPKPAAPIPQSPACLSWSDHSNLWPVFAE